MHTFAIKKLKEKKDSMVVDCSLCVCTVWWLNENPKLQKIFFWRLGFFFKTGKKSPKFHQISTPENTQKTPEKTDTLV